MTVVDACPGCAGYWELARHFRRALCLQMSTSAPCLVFATLYSFLFSPCGHVCRRRPCPAPPGCQPTGARPPAHGQHPCSLPPGQDRLGRGCSSALTDQCRTRNSAVQRSIDTRHAVQPPDSCEPGSAPSGKATRLCIPGGLHSLKFRPSVLPCRTTTLAGAVPAARTHSRRCGGIQPAGPRAPAPAPGEGALPACTWPRRHPGCLFAVACVLPTPAAIDSSVGLGRTIPLAHSLLQLWATGVVGRGTGKSFATGSGAGVATNLIRPARLTPQVGGSGGIKAMWARISADEDPLQGPFQAGLRPQWRQLANIEGTAQWELRRDKPKCPLTCHPPTLNGIVRKCVRLFSCSSKGLHILQPINPASHLSTHACSGVPPAPLDLLIYPAGAGPLLAV